MFSLSVDPGFYLMVMSVIIIEPDGVDQVFPVAWFVSNRKDKEIINICFSQVKVIFTCSKFVLLKNCLHHDMWKTCFLKK